MGSRQEGAFQWREFVPVAAALVVDHFQQRDWEARQANPWVRLFDKDLGYHYYYDRRTGAAELCRSQGHLKMGAFEDGPVWETGS